MHKMNSTSPTRERLSIVLATILLAYLLAQYVDVPTSQISFSLLGVGIPIQINFNTLVGIAVAAITASGTAWLIQNHPRASETSVLPHIILPSLTSLILNILLANLAFSPLWWAYFVLGAVFLLFVILLEYIVADNDDYRQPYAATGLNALSIAEFLVLGVSLKSTNLRLVYLLPPLFLAATIVTLRASHLREKNRWLFPQAITCGIVTAQLAAALHYIPISPLQFGLILLGPVYAITSMVINLEQNPAIRQAITEPLIILGVIWVLAIWL